MATFDYIAGRTLTRSPGTIDMVMGNGGLEFNSGSSIQIPYRSALTFSKLRTVVTANTVTLATTITNRVGGVNKTLSISITASTTGEFSDLVHTDTIASGNQVQARMVVGAAGTSLTLTSLAFTVDTAYINYAFACQTNFATASTTAFYGLAGHGGQPDATESKIQSTCRSNGTMTNAYIQAIGNSRAAATTYASRKNTANGNMAISVTGSTTGIFEDNVNTDTIASGDLFNHSITTGAGTGSISFGVGAGFIPDSANIYQCVGYDSNFVAVAATTLYLVPGGCFHTSTTEADMQVRVKGYASASNLALRLVTNAGSGDHTAAFRVNGASGNQALSITHGTTGYFEDQTHTDVVKSDDQISLQITGATGANASFSINSFHLQALIISFDFKADAPDRYPFAAARACDYGAQDNRVIALDKFVVNHLEWQPRYDVIVPVLKPQRQFQVHHVEPFVVDLPQQVLSFKMARPRYDDLIPWAKPRQAHLDLAAEPIVINIQKFNVAALSWGPEFADFVLPARAIRPMFDMSDESIQFAVPEIVTSDKWTGRFPESISRAKAALYTMAHYTDDEPQRQARYNWEPEYPDFLLLAPSRQRQTTAQQYTVDEATRLDSYQWQPSQPDMLLAARRGALYATAQQYTADEATRQDSYQWEPSLPDFARSARRAYYDTELYYSPDEALREAKYNWKASYPDAVPSARRSFYVTQFYQTQDEALRAAHYDWTPSQPDFVLGARRAYYATINYYADDEALRLVKYIMPVSYPVALPGTKRFDTYLFYTNDEALREAKYHWEPDSPDFVLSARRAYYETQFYQTQDEALREAVYDWRPSVPDFARAAPRAYYVTPNVYTDDEALRLTRYHWAPSFPDALRGLRAQPTQDVFVKRVDPINPANPDWHPVYPDMIYSTLLRQDYVACGVDTVSFTDPIRYARVGRGDGIFAKAFNGTAVYEDAATQDAVYAKATDTNAIYERAVDEGGTFSKSRSFTVTITRRTH